MTILILALLFLIVIVALTVILQYRRSTMQYRRLALSLCDPGSWSVRFLIRIVILAGKVDGLPIRYSVLGSPNAESFAASHLLLLCPVKRNLRIYGESDLGRLEDEIREELEVLQQAEGFRSLIFTPAASPFLGKILSRPLGFTHEPGILLSRVGAGAFDAGAIKSDVFLLRRLCQKGA